jgi:hypothetical protein
MRPTLLALLPAAFLFTACLAHTAYGPSSDDRLDESTSERPSRDGAEAAALSCSDLAVQLRKARLDDQPEADRLKALIEIFGVARSRADRLDEAIGRNPDLVYSADGDAIKANQEECRAVFADSRSDLDRSVREIVELPVIQEVHGRRTVSVARLDFGLVRSAIATLDPDDKDFLLGRLDAAEKRVSSDR